MSSDTQTPESVAETVAAAVRAAQDAAYHQGAGDSRDDWDTIRQGQILLAKQIESIGYAIQCCGDTWSNPDAREALEAALVRCAHLVHPEAD